MHNLSFNNSTELDRPPTPEADSSEVGPPTPENTNEEGIPTIP